MDLILITKKQEKRKSNLGQFWKGKPFGFWGGIETLILWLFFGRDYMTNWNQRLIEIELWIWGCLLDNKKISMKFSKWIEKVERKWGSGVAKNSQNLHIWKPSEYNRMILNFLSRLLNFGYIKVCLIRAQNIPRFKMNINSEHYTKEYITTPIYNLQS